MYIIYGAGGFGREVAWLIERANASLTSPERVMAFADDAAVKGQSLRARPVLPLDEAIRCFPGASVVLAVGSGTARQAMVERVKVLGAKCATVIDPTAEADWTTLQMGEGCVICAHTLITVDVTLGRHVHVNLDCTIGHDAVLEDFVTLAPGVHVSGRVTIKSGAYIGTGASIINGDTDKPLVIGEDAVVGAQACVIRDVPANARIGGVPAKDLHRSTGTG